MTVRVMAVLRAPEIGYSVFLPYFLVKRRLKSFSLVLTRNIGLTERFLHSVNVIIRWLVDSSYWIYILHLPVVCGITFYLFDFDWWPEGEFLIACVLTSSICFVSYQLLVRYTFMGSLLNGKRRKLSRLRN